MKAGVEHQVTLSSAAISILDEMDRGAPDAPIFRGSARGGHLSNMAMKMLMRRMGFGQFTVHGFRSAFKDWASNETDFADELSEEALAHLVGSKVRRAYRRGVALERRRALMEAWAKHVLGASNVVELAA
jgi:integrase